MALSGRLDSEGFHCRPSFVLSVVLVSELTDTIVSTSDTLSLPRPHYNSLPSI